MILSKDPYLRKYVSHQKYLGISGSADDKVSCCQDPRFNLFTPYPIIPCYYYLVVNCPIKKNNVISVVSNLFGPSCTVTDLNYIHDIPDAFEISGVVIMLPVM